MSAPTRASTSAGSRVTMSACSARVRAVARLVSIREQTRLRQAGQRHAPPGRLERRRPTGTSVGDACVLRDRPGHKEQRMEKAGLLKTRKSQASEDHTDVTVGM